MIKIAESKFAGQMSVVGRGEASEVQMSLFPPTLKTVVRYADPISWIGATAVGRALAGVGNGIAEIKHTVGVIGVSEFGPAEATAAVAEASAAGFSSPLRYPAANAGSLAGVTCIAQGFRGPTMVLTMPAKTGVETALTLAGGWTRREMASLVVVLACTSLGHRQYRARCLMVGSDPLKAGLAGEALTAEDRRWLAGSDNSRRQGK